MPKPRVLDSSAKVPGTDGEKMSKSYNNTLELFEELKPLRNKIKRIQTDSRPMEDPKDPDQDHLYQLYSLFASEDQAAAMATKYRQGGFGYGDVKKAIIEVSESYFAEARARREELVAHPQRVEEILCDGASRARKKAGDVLLRAQQATGLRR